MQPPAGAPIDAINTPEACPLTRLFGRIGGKWKIPLLWVLASGPHRYSDLRRALPEVSERMLIRSLRELEADGFVARTQYPEVPPRVEYALTSLGTSLTPLLGNLAAWSHEHLA